ncbi:hypothetical protein M427DRAFT_348460 [Gonapodya prolifera JEL478]|uniref:Uncharacterized protein n=1 Tax=Gonapodya prolifera (strain JEL478) TaxID=1344416 RepID=A0A139AW27_GONPJ|nr:hypothetical protein M427DRAFT_348460 [Gonapodya prolifera JEL478]|eukprot:KXS20904.1 hypothetical protein M427DRAFT_348460 [Gonapodya prolifera JEL478]
MLVADDLPELGPNLVSTLASLQMHFKKTEGWHTVSDGVERIKGHAKDKEG